MARKVFYSFHFNNDFWRTNQVRHINALEGQRLASPNDWEELKRKGDASIQKWIDDQLIGKSCLIVLVGSETANRKWVRYEIIKAWNEKKGVLGIRIDKMLDSDGVPSNAGQNPFERITMGGGPKTLAEFATLKTPVGTDSKAVYASIAANIESWIEEAIKNRANH